MRALVIASLLIMLILVILNPASAITVCIDSPVNEAQEHTFNVTIDISDLNDQKIAGFDLWIEYNGMLTTAEDVVPSENIANWNVYYTTYSIGETTNIVRVVGVYTGETDTLITQDAMLFNITFRALENGTAIFKVNNTLSKLINDSETYLSFTLNPNQVQTVIWKYGDVNGDNTVDLKDVIRLVKMIVNPIIPRTVTADVNDDNNIDATDLVELINYVLTQGVQI